MSQALSKNFIADDFNPEKFVKELSSQCIGAEELRQQRAKIQELADSTSASLKRNVYQNYIQFIETAKEISHLESEMYQLSQLLSDQRLLLSIFRNNQNTDIILKNDSESDLENFLHFQSKKESQWKLMQLLGNVEGAKSLAETPGRICFHEGSLLELDPLEGSPMKKIHAYLFNDVLMIASWLSNGSKKRLQRYRLQVVYDLQNIAIVNVKDLGNAKFAFKLLASPDSRIFQCVTATSKKEWLEKYEQAKKFKSCSDNQLQVINEEKSIKLEQEYSASGSIFIESYTPGDTKQPIGSKSSFPDWILEVREDLDAFIAQRHFEETYNLLIKAKIFLAATHNEPQANVIKLKLIDRTDFLVRVLTKELELSAEAQSLQGGGLRNARRAVRFLIQLDRSSQASEFYLRLCSAVLKSYLKKVKREGATLPYIKQLSAIAFSCIVEISREFLRIFSQFTNCISAFIIWCSNEVTVLTSHLVKQIFIPQVSLNILVECIMTIRDHCEQLTQVGIDLRYQLDTHFRTPLSKVLHDTGEKYVDAVKVRTAEDSWKPSNFQSVQNLNKLLSELDDLGIPLPKSYMKNEHWIPLTNNTLTFSKLYIGLLEDCLNVATPEVVAVIEDVLISVLHAQITHLRLSLTDSKLKKERKVVQDNFLYVHDVIITRSLELYKSTIGIQFARLLKLQEQLQPDLTSITGRPQSVNRTSIPKYCSMDYI